MAASPLQVQNALSLSALGVPPEQVRSVGDGTRRRRGRRGGRGRQTSRRPAAALR